MIEFLNSYWPLLLGAIMIGAIAGMIFLRPRQRVTLNPDAAPVRPHMTPAARDVAGAAIRTAGEGRGLGDEIAAAASDVAGPILGVNAHHQLPGAEGRADDLSKLKGVGPKLAALLAAHGLSRFDQLASLSDGQIEAIDATLGAFKGRLARDRVVEQAHYLARGDTDGYQQKFGKL